MFQSAVNEMHTPKSKEGNCIQAVQVHNTKTQFNSRITMIKTVTANCYLVVQLIAISRAYRSIDLDKGHRVGLSDYFSSCPTSHRLITISRTNQVRK